MKELELRDAIARNLSSAGLPLDELSIVPDPYGGWNVLVVSGGFEGKPRDARRVLALNGIDESDLELVDLLTAEERAWTPSLTDYGIADIPLWPEALARRSPRNASDVAELDEASIDLPLRVTFYSLRGGVGRSTALAYAARILASRGYKVIAVDMDLEAPGLSTLFGVDANVVPTMGVVELLAALDRGEQVDVTRHLVRVSDEVDLYCLPAGIPSANYARHLRQLDPDAWYREDTNPLRSLYASLACDLPFRPDVILTDARTGLSNLNGPLLFDVADMVIIVFFPHPQARVGNGEVVRALSFASTQRSNVNREFRPDLRFVVSPVPSARAGDFGRHYRNRAAEWISEWLNIGEPGDAASVESDVTHFISYMDTIAASDTASEVTEIWRPYVQVADWIESIVPAPHTSSVAVGASAGRQAVLTQLQFSAGTAEQQADLLENFVETDVFKKALSPSIPLILGRKGTGKTALFRRLAEEGRFASTVITSPGPLRQNRPWLLSAEGFRRVEQELERVGASWRQFWSLYIVTALYGQNHSNSLDAVLAREIGGSIVDEVGVVDALTRLLAINNSVLLADASLKKLDAALASPAFLLFDGLDTGFGPSDADRARRRSALEGLFVFFSEVGDTLVNFYCKILLREDLWRHLRFENKSHFFGRSVVLKWSDQASFFKVALKQALRSEAFRNLLPDHIATVQAEEWSDDTVFRVWNVLASERMKGSKTTFTRNWVWNRLADANDDHSPRYLLQLMNLAVEFERVHKTSSSTEGPNVIRPRSFIEVLPDVSEQALSAIRDEEFPELRPLLERLTSVGRTPVDYADLSSIGGDVLGLAREVGLIGIYEGDEERVERFKVPELFRHALKMTRKGQV
jgi:MinD-like ATPase involved in chromosome partitioning or flagellar assembly